MKTFRGNTLASMKNGILRLKGAPSLHSKRCLVYMRRSGVVIPLLLNTWRSPQTTELVRCMVTFVQQHSFLLCFLLVCGCNPYFGAITNFARTGLVTLYFESSNNSNNQRNCGSIEREPRPIKSIATTDVRNDRPQSSRVRKQDLHISQCILS